MGWRDLIQTNEEIVLPWIGGRHLRSSDRTWTISGKLPQEHGWYRFSLTGRKAEIIEPTDQYNLAWPGFPFREKGYLVGDRFIPDHLQLALTPAVIATAMAETHLIEPGIDRFARIEVGTVYEHGPRIFSRLEMPSGPEAEVLDAFLNEQESIRNIAGISPALEAAFRMETFQRAEANRRRAELERLRREEEARLAAEERRKELEKTVGSAVGRRVMAAVDFSEAARSALRVSGAEYLDHRKGARKTEMVVRFRWINRRFECVVDSSTLRVIDSGICLTAHYDDDEFEGGTKGDTWLSLESLPGVIQEANREHKLVVFRHVY